jgi:DNA-directed RNA polymerase subunit RPC12/RpoP
MKRNCTTVKDDKALICSECGNKERFVEVMAVETHLVNSRKDYIRLLDGIADHYLCWNCGATVQNGSANQV